MSRRSASVRLVLALAGCCALLSPAAARAVDAAWFPLEPGSRWVYEVHRDYTHWPEDAPIDRIFWKGRTVRTTRATDRAGRIEVEQRTDLKLIDGPASESRTKLEVMSLDGGLLLHASGATEAVPQSPPLRMLPTTSIGESWQVGTAHSGTARIALRGEVRDVTGKDPSGMGCTGCIEVRYSGPISGTLPVESGEARIESGRYERVVWLRREVGIVREVETTEVELLEADGKHTKSVEVLTSRLVEHAIAE